MRSRWIVSALLAGVIGWLLFMTVHAALIVPIWDRGFGGLAFAILAGVALAATAHITRTTTVARAALLGVIVWLLLIPPTAVGAWLRLSHLRERMAGWDVAVVLAVAAASGYLGGRLFRRGGRMALILGACMAALVVAMAGPIPVTNSTRAALLFVAFLPMYVVGSMIVTWMNPRM